MNYAKQLLVQSGASLRAIAQCVGFQDEFYFSRKFKSEVGCSPKAFVSNLQSSYKIASLNHLSTGHLMALGIEPYAAVINNAFPVTSGLRKTIAIGRIQPEWERLATVKPDLIVSRSFRNGKPPGEEGLLHRIAPSVTLPYNGDWRTHLRTLAESVNKEAAAEQWLSRYGQKANAIRKRMPDSCKSASFLAVGIGTGRLCVYGLRNVGSVLYGDLHMAMPDGVADIVHYREVTIEQLASFDADCIVLTGYRHDGSARQDRAIAAEWESLQAHPAWQSLRAVRHRRVCLLHDSRHLYTSYNALSHDLLLDKIDRWSLTSTAER